MQHAGYAASVKSRHSPQNDKTATRTCQGVPHPFKFSWIYNVRTILLRDLNLDYRFPLRTECQNVFHNFSTVENIHRELN